MSCDGTLCVAKNRRNLSNVLTGVYEANTVKYGTNVFAYDSQKSLRVHKTRLFTVRVRRPDRTFSPHTRRLKTLAVGRLTSPSRPLSNRTRLSTVENYIRTFRATKPGKKQTSNIRCLARRWRLFRLDTNRLGQSKIHPKTQNT